MLRSPWLPGGKHQQAADQTRHQCWVQDSHTHDADLGTKLIDQNLEFPCRAFPGSVGPTRYDCSLLQAILQVKPPPWVPPVLMGHHLSCTSPDAQQPPSSLSSNTTLSSTGKSKYRVIGRKGLGGGGQKPWLGERRLRKDTPVNGSLGPSAAPGIFSFQKA